MKMRFYLLLALFCSDSRAANIFERAPRNCYCRTLQLHHEKLSILNSRFCPSHGLRTPDKDFFQKCPKCFGQFWLMCGPNKLWGDFRLHSQQTFCHCMSLVHDFSPKKKAFRTFKINRYLFWFGIRFWP